MLPKNKQNERRFDEMLKKTLKEHREPVQLDFVRRLLTRIKTIEQQKALAKAIRQERGLLAAYILVPIAAIVVMFAFPNLTIESGRQMTMLYSLIILSVKNIMSHWQLWIYYVIAAAACLYAFYETFLTEH